MKLINLTAHSVIVIQGETILEIPASGIVARATERSQYVGSVTMGNFEIPIVRKVYANVQGLPAVTEGVGFIVSKIVAQSCPERDDLFIPADMVRNYDGKILGCKALSRLKEERQND